MAPAESLSPRLKFLNWSGIFFAVLQSVCSALVALSGLRLLIGIGAFAAASGAMHIADRMHVPAIRIPMMLLALLGSLSNLVRTVACQEPPPSLRVSLAPEPHHQAEKTLGIYPARDLFTDIAASRRGIRRSLQDDSITSLDSRSCRNSRGLSAGSATAAVHLLFQTNMQSFAESHRQFKRAVIRGQHQNVARGIQNCRANLTVLPDVARFHRAIRRKRSWSMYSEMCAHHVLAVQLHGILPQNPFRAGAVVFR